MTQYRTRPQRIDRNGRPADGSGRTAGRSRQIFVLFLPAVAAGCHAAPAEGRPINVRPRVTLVRPEKRTVARTIGQPSFVYAFEQTSLYPKITGYIEKWYVDIGDHIDKGQTLAKIYAPELNAQLQRSQGQVVESEAQVRVAEQTVNVAEHNYAAATAQTEQARAAVARYQAAVDRWELEVKRLTVASSERVINPQILSESKQQLKADIAAWDAAKATVVAARATELARKADLDKAKVDVEAARAKVMVVRAEAERAAAFVSYTYIRAPYDGIVVDRNANSGDYVEPGKGDLSAQRNTSAESANQGAPIYVVARTDEVRIYVDVPEAESDYVVPGTKAMISIPALQAADIDGTVARTSWSLLIRSRTLRAEVDLPNPQGRIRPGMYAYGKIRIERRDALTLPLHCVIESGNQNVCFLYENGRAVETPVRTGINDGKWVEVFGKQEDGGWTPFTGTEQVIAGDLAQLTSGQAVEVAEPPASPRPAGRP